MTRSNLTLVLVLVVFAWLCAFLTQYLDLGSMIGVQNAFLSTSIVLIGAVALVGGIILSRGRNAA
ncbi:hypothetical protein DMC47_12975 [Nostoc sp. 3335mG]|jgi:hypothetical protein|nr:hypothetical protein DMC47_12975 [Nostoc sp. 3335mG]